MTRSSSTRTRTGSVPDTNRLTGIAEDIAEIAQRNTGTREWEPEVKTADAPADAAHAPRPSLLPQRDSLYNEFRPLIARLIRKYGDSPEQRQDLEGEIYCLFSDLLEAFDPDRGVPLKAYLVHQLSTSVYTLARRRWRQERRELCMEIRDDAVRSADDPSAAWDTDMAMEQVGEALPDAIAMLPVRQRQVLIWRYYEQRSFEEIAESLGGVQVSTTRSLLRHALTNLRKNFAAAGVSLNGFEE